MGVTIREIAEAAGVSRGTVDRALNNRGRIRPEVAEKIKKIAEEMGYRPNQLGRALSMSKNNIKIGVIIQGAETPFMHEVLKGVDAAAKEVDSFGGTVILHKIQHINEEEVLASMEAMREEGVSAIALVPHDAESIKKRINLFVKEYQIPIVTFTSDVPDTERMCFVGQNSLQCGRAAAGLMGELMGGNGKVAVISGYSTNTSLSNRVQGFCTEMQGKYPQIEIIGPEYCFEENDKAEEITEGLLEQYPDLCGIYLTSHGEEGVCEAMKKYKKAGQIKMVANDFMGKNYELLKEGSIHFLIGQDARVQGYEPVMVLFRLLFHGERPDGTLQYTEIYIRNEYTIPEKEVF